MPGCTMTLNIFKSRRKSMTVSDRHPVYKVHYLGNVQTVLAKGDNCADKPLATLWRNFEVRGGAPNVGSPMKVTLCPSGMKAHTREQGITEYWANRITYCAAATDPAHSKLFCWIYRHEARKMKVELRCHAVVCKKAEHAQAMAAQLQDRLTQALNDFVREKRKRQNARLALHKFKSPPLTHVGGSLPRRKQLLTSAHNFKPPLEKSKAAPRLNSIDEEDGSLLGGLLRPCDHLSGETCEACGSLAARLRTLSRLQDQDVDEDEEDIDEDILEVEDGDSYQSSSTSSDLTEAEADISSKSSSPEISSKPNPRPAASARDDFFHIRHDHFKDIRDFKDYEEEEEDSFDGQSYTSSSQDSDVPPESPLLFGMPLRDHFKDELSDRVSDESGYSEDLTSGGVVVLSVTSGAAAAPPPQVLKRAAPPPPPASSDRTRNLPANTQASNGPVRININNGGQEKLGSG